MEIQNILSQELDTRLFRIERNQDELRELILAGSKFNKPQKQRLTRKDVCDQYGISLPKLHDLMKKGLPFAKIGRKTLFVPSQVEDFFNSKNVRL